MKTLTLTHFILSFLLIHSLNLTAQTDNSTFGLAHTPQGNLHVLVLFIGFNDETAIPGINTK
jgi:hypothetical protein